MEDLLVGYRLRISMTFSFLRTENLLILGIQLQCSMKGGAFSFFCTSLKFFFGAVYVIKQFDLFAVLFPSESCNSNCCYGYALSLC